MNEWCDGGGGLYTMRLVMESKVEVDNKSAHQKDTKDSGTPQIIISTDHTTIDHPKGKSWFEYTDKIKYYRDHPYDLPCPFFEAV